MFDERSRYSALEDAVLTLPGGRAIAYKRRRFVPPAGAHQPIGSVVVAASDRVDLVAERGLGDPEQFWRLCDANGALQPAELVAPGRRLDVPLPAP
jgi:hypothetical protein